MGQVFESIDEKLSDWIQKQEMFFVSTAPVASDGLINCSPKGLNAFEILGPNSVAYLDLTGSGVETIAHLKENGRIVIMFCEFNGSPKIVRLHGKGIVHEIGTVRFAELADMFPDLPGKRSVIEIEVTRISDSCGWGVPRMEFIEQRSTLLNSATKKGPEGIHEYRVTRNATSVDGLPGFSSQKKAPKNG